MLIVAGTGLGKTLGASVLVFNDWLQQHYVITKSSKKKATDLVIWISPLKALSRNLVQQSEQIRPATSND